MRILTITLLTVALLVFALGCGGKDAPGDAKGGDAKKAEAPAKPSFRYQFKPGQTLRYRTTTDTKMQMMGMPIEAGQVQEQTWKVLEVDDEGNAKIEVTFDAVKFDLNNPMTGPISYDSTAENAAEQASNPAVAQAAVFLGKKIILKTTPTGRVVETEGFEAIIEEIVKANPMAGGMVDKDAMKTQAEGFVTRLPEEDLDVGGEWTDEVVTEGGMTGSVTMNLTGKVKSIDEVEGAKIGTLEIAGVIDTSKLKMPEGDPSNPMSQMKISDGKLTGESKFDMTNGQIVHHRVVTTMTLEMMGQASEMVVTQITERID